MNVLQGQWPMLGSQPTAQSGPWPVDDRPTTRSVIRDDLTPAGYRLVIGPEVIRHLGGELITSRTLAQISPMYRCSTCGQEGRLDRGSAASVLVLVSPDDAPEQICLAHPGCCDSAVRMLPATSPLTPDATLPGLAWLRPADTDPAAVAVLTAGTGAEPARSEVGALRALLTNLLPQGFEPMADPEARLPMAPRLTAAYTSGTLTVYGEYGQTVWSGQLDAPQPWTFAAMRARTVGLVVAMTALSDRPSAGELEWAIRSGKAAGLAVSLANHGANAPKAPSASGGSTGVLLPMGQRHQFVPRQHSRAA